MMSFNMFSQILGVASTCVHTLSVCPNTNQAIVDFNNGSKYLYNNVDFEGIMDLLCGEHKSLGKFVNAYCLGNDCLKLA